MVRMPLVGLLKKLVDRGVIGIEIGFTATSEDQQVGIIAIIGVFRSFEFL